jgi:phosphate-selective porin OprO/OprP
MSTVRQWGPFAVIWVGTLGLGRSAGAQQDTVARRDSQPRVAAGREGFVITSADGEFQLTLRSYAQADGRFFPGGAPALGTSSLFLRRARTVTEVTGWRYFTLRLTPDFGQGRVVLFDAYLDFRLGPVLTLRAGKTKPPVGFERLQSARDIRFVERALPTNLVPNRDVGFQALGAVGGGVLCYSVGIFNGAPDLGNLDGDATNDKDVAVRLFAQPFLTRAADAWRDLGIGAAASTGNEHGSVSAPSLPAYLTPGQQTAFRYRDSTVANGRRYRLTPQAYYYVGPLGVLWEYVVSSQTVTRGSTASHVKHTSWQVAGSWYVTGERASFASVTPRQPFNPTAGHWGALEVAARYSDLALDDGTFPGFASAATSVREAKAWAVGVTWHFARAIQLYLDYEQTRFTGGATSGDRATEHFLVTRFQQSF